MVVPAHDAEATLAACLTTLERQTVGREGLELIVVDDGSTHGTAEVAR